MSDSGYFPPPPPPSTPPGYPVPPGYRLVPARPGLGATHWLHLATFATGLAALFLGFAPAAESSAGISEDYLGAVYSVSIYEGGAGLTPALLFTAGFVALLSVLPGGRERTGPGPIVPALSVGVTLEMLFSTFTMPEEQEAAVGWIMVMVLCVLQSVIALIAYVIGRSEPGNR